ncbi:MAG TPA: sulfatase [Pirellulales bacterium]|nr:sulfatase [Pirellulales bacterium]
MTFAAERPNIVVIMADDLGWADLGCTGSTFYETPHIDRLAREGLRFTTAYSACPVCSPTRAAAMTGKYPARVHLTDYIPGARRGRLNPAPYLHHLPLEESTIAEALRDGGYATALVGKWHLGDEGFWPQDQGFDPNVAGSGKGANKLFSPYTLPNLADGPEGEYLTDRLTDEALRYITTQRERPFLLWLTHYDVHTPLVAKQELIDRFEKKAGKLPPAKSPRFRPEHEREDRRVQDHAVYAAKVASLDESVGRIVQKLDELGLTEQTIVIFTSDNGGLSTSEGSPTSNAPLRAGKGWLYEGGIRVPLIVRWPGVAKPASTCDVPVITNDLYPTLLAAADLPARPAQHCDGVSLAGLLTGKNAKLDREALYWHYPHYGNQGGSPGGAIREGDWKLIEFFEDNHVELYNLADDSGEQHDLAAEMQDRAAQLREKLAAWRTSVDAQMPTANPDYVPGAKPQ